MVGRNSEIYVHFFNANPFTDYSGIAPHPGPAPVCSVPCADTHILYVYVVRRPRRRAATHKDICVVSRHAAHRDTTSRIPAAARRQQPTPPPTDAVPVEKGVARWPSAEPRRASPERGAEGARGRRGARRRPRPAERR